MNAALSGNIWKYTVFNITSARVYMPVIALYFLSVGEVTLVTVGILFAVVQVTQALLELPTGYIADRIGYKRTLIVSRGFYLLSTLVFLVGGEVMMYAGAFLYGVALSFTSGTLAAFIHSSLEEEGKGDQYARITGRSQAITLVISAILLSVVPSLFPIDPRIPFIIALLLDVVGLLTTCLFIAPRKLQSEHTAKSLAEIFADAVRNNVVQFSFLTSLLSAIILGAKTLQDAFQASVGVPVAILGVLFALNKIISAGLMLVPWTLYIKKLGEHKALLVFAIILFMLSLPLFLSTSPYLIAASFLLASGVLWGLMPTFGQMTLQRIGDSSHKATMLSFTGLIGSLLLAATSIVLGVSTDLFEYSLGYLLYFAMFGFLWLLSFLFLLPHKVKSIS